MAKVNLLYPDELVAVYGDSVTIRYETVDVLSTDKIKKIVFLLNDNDKVETENLKGFYFFDNLEEGTQTLSGYLLNESNKKVKSSDFTFNFTTINKKYTPEKKLSSVVAKRIPEFIQNDHPRFVKFIEAYYEWLESSNNPYYMNIASGDFFDIDKTPDLFINRFRRQYLDNFPEEFATNLNGDTPNLKTVIKNIKQFYGAKGTEKSFKFFFRLLYDTFVEFYYPKNDILKASASNWIEKRSIKIICPNLDLVHQLKGRILYQAKNDGSVYYTARATAVEVYKNEELTIAEISIAFDNGVFNSFDKIYCDIEDERIVATIVHVVTQIDIQNGGFGYNTGDIVTISYESTASTVKGKSAKGKIVKVGSKGNILKIDMYDTGSFNINTNSDSPTVTINSEHGGNAILNATYSGISEYPGYYARKQGHISFNKKLQDNRRYQDLSYVLKTDMVLNDYIVLLKNLVHPAGFYVGGDILLKGEYFDLAKSANGIRREFRNLIGNFIAYRLNCNFNVRNFEAPPWRIDLQLSGSGDIFPFGFDPNDTIPLQTIEALYQDSSDFEQAVIVHNTDNKDQLNEGVSEVVFGNIPEVSDFEQMNTYWVVFPHPDFDSTSTNQIKEFNQLTIEEFVINSRNDVLFNLSDS